MKDGYWIVAVMNGVSLKSEGRRDGRGIKLIGLKLSVRLFAEETSSNNEAIIKVCQERRGGLGSFIAVRFLFCIFFFFTVLFPSTKRVPPRRYIRER